MTDAVEVKSETVVYQDPTMTDEEKAKLAEYKAQLAEKFGDKQEPVVL